MRCICLDERNRHCGGQGARRRPDAGAARLWTAPGLLATCEAVLLDGILSGRAAQWALFRAGGVHWCVCGVLLLLFVSRISITVEHTPLTEAPESFPQ